MNSEQQELLNEAYKKYCESFNQTLIEQYSFDTGPMTQSMFIGRCKFVTEFSERWGLRIEERELSIDEKEWQLEKTNCINDIENDRIIYGHEWEKYIQEQYEGIESTQGIKIPTRLITVTYNDKTIERYE
jgi:hypothetical protein